MGSPAHLPRPPPSRGRGIGPGPVEELLSETARCGTSNLDT